MKVILFCFAGRRQNMELQIPLVRRVLERNPETQYHIWNLARDGSDYRWLQRFSDEFVLFNEFYGADPWLKFNSVYRYYAQPFFRDYLFVKLDDDVVFFSANRFGDFVNAVDRNRDSVISAKVINNGACTPTEPELWNRVGVLDIPLLDVHKSAEYAEVSHAYAAENFDALINQPIKLIPTADWLSINMIGYDWNLGRNIASAVGTPTPSLIAGRELSGNIGDEGAVNLLSRKICQGFLAGHLTFGPQSKDEAQEQLWRKQYAELGKTYLSEKYV